MSNLNGWYPLTLYLVLAMCIGLLATLQFNGIGFIETSVWTLVLALGLGILFCRSAARFAFSEHQLRIQYLMSKDITIDLSAYALEDYRLNFFSMDWKSQIFITGVPDTLLFVNTRTGDRKSVVLNSRMSDTRKLLNFLDDSPAAEVLRVRDRSK
ncbi:MAG: hypothetical protein IPO60_03175 [Flavobacteriales bacterium]|nr:hypothetical protein [Flavobacteriales bacterium]MBK7246303.1 hypothetical protein [Flavobacteriales bacterium]MBK7286106.1 hypothetical protein [Flavobacteriales bacterium]MBK9059923.1 hypothetical protein [Flavobacteriales bacterium]MBK9597340.1 hypothetical protein [Flavobacteriales bacterium]